MRILSHLLLCTALSPLFAQAQDSASALKQLQALKPKVSWAQTGSLRADVNCDAQADTLILGQEKTAKGGLRVWLGVVSGKPGSVPQTFDFGIDSGSQDALCESKVRLQAKPLVCDTGDGPLPGCKAEKNCKAFDLMDDACDSFHFYFDRNQNKLVYWRN